MEKITFKNLFQESWNIYLDNFKGLLIIGLILFLPLNAILEITIPSSPGEEIEISEDMSWNEIIIGEYDFNSYTTWIGILAIIALSFVDIYVTIICILLIQKTINKEKIDLNKIASASKKYIWPVLLTSLMATIFLIPFYIIIIPGIIFSIYWIFISETIVVNDKRYIEALKYSRQLVKGRWWNVLGNTLLITLIFIAFLLFLYLPTEALMGTIFGIETITDTILDIVSIFVSIFFAVYFFKLKKELESSKDSI